MLPPNGDLCVINLIFTSPDGMFYQELDGLWLDEVWVREFFSGISPEAEFVCRYGYTVWLLDKKRKKWLK